MTARLLDGPSQVWLVWLVGRGLVMFAVEGPFPSQLG